MITDTYSGAEQSRSKFAIARWRLGPHLTLAEKILLAFSKHPADVPGNYDEYLDDLEPNPDPLKNLRYWFPALDAMVRDKRVLDFACGDGEQTIALAQLGAKEVLGVDTNERRIARARKLANDAPHVAFSDKLEGTFHVIISQDAFEHLADTEGMLRQILSHLDPGGQLVISFGPLWWSPYGAHMHFFTRLPWVHLLFSERTVMRVRSIYRRPFPNDRYSDDMNKLSTGSFLSILHALGENVSVDHLCIACVKRLDFLARIPIVRELFVNNISCILTKRDERIVEHRSVRSSAS